MPRGPDADKRLLAVSRWWRVTPGRVRASRPLSVEDMIGVVPVDVAGAD
jgi:hypothetical protein